MGEILLLLLSLFSTFTFSKHFLVKVADEVEDEKVSYEEDKVKDKKRAHKNGGLKVNRFMPPGMGGMHMGGGQGMPQMGGRPGMHMGGGQGMPQMGGMQMGGRPGMQMGGGPGMQMGGRPGMQMGGGFG